MKLCLCRVAFVAQNCLLFRIRFFIKFREIFFIRYKMKFLSIRQYVFVKVSWNSYSFFYGVNIKLINVGGKEFVNWYQNRKELLYCNEGCYGKFFTNEINMYLQSDTTKSVLLIVRFSNKIAPTEEHIFCVLIMIFNYPVDHLRFLHSRKGKTSHNLEPTQLTLSVNFGPVDNQPTNSQSRIKDFLSSPNKNTVFWDSLKISAIF